MNHKWSNIDPAAGSRYVRRCLRCGVEAVVDLSGGKHGGVRETVGGVVVGRGAPMPKCEPKPEVSRV